MSRTPSLATGCARQPGEALHREGYRGLVARYAPINQGPGGLWLYDSSRRGPPGQLVNMTGANWESSHLGTVVNYPVLINDIRIPSRAELQPLELTVRILFRTGAVFANLYVLAKGVGVGLIDYQVLMNAGGSIIIQFNNGAAHNNLTPVGTVVANQWYDLTFTLGLGRCRIWVNGALVTDAAEAQVMPQAGMDLYLGCNGAGGNSFQGHLALVEIWNYCLPKPLSPDPHFLAHAG